MITNLEKIRKEKHLSRRALSDISGVPQNTIYALEKGINNIAYAKIKTLIDLAQGLGVKVKDIMPNDLQEFVG